MFKFARDTHVLILVCAHNFIFAPENSVLQVASTVCLGVCCNRYSHPLTMRNTTAADRKAIFITCFSSMRDGVLKRGVFRELATTMGFERKTVARQWYSMQAKLAPLLINHPDNDHADIISRNSHILFETDHCKRRKGRYKRDRMALQEQVRAVPLKQRRSMRKLSARVNVPVTTLHNYLKARLPRKPPIGDNDAAVVFVRHRSKLKPTLTATNKLARMEFALEQVNPATMGNRTARYFGQEDKVHLDEKWFYLCKDGEQYILTAGEDAPERHVKHKNFIEKVMFLCAQARPRMDHTTRSMWDGKIGMWPIGKYKAAARSSVNRPRGTIEWVNETIDQESYKDLLVNNVLPAILEKWPHGQFQEVDFVVRIQQDGAGGHCSHDDEYLQEAIEELGLTGKVEFYTQPPNSPDLNVCDLGLFAALQAAYYDHAPKNAIELIQMVQRTYQDYDYRKINRIFITLQSVFNCIIENYGGNQYKIPHMNKARLERLDELPVTLEVTDAAYDYL